MKPGQCPTCGQEMTMEEDAGGTFFGYCINCECNKTMNDPEFGKKPDPQTTEKKPKDVFGVQVPTDDTFAAHEKYEEVNHPKHYNSHPSGIECITIARHHNFNIGSVFKYLWRQGLKPGESSITDLNKAIWFLRDEVERLTALEDKKFKGDDRGIDQAGVHHIPGVGDMIFTKEDKTLKMR